MDAQGYTGQPFTVTVEEKPHRGRITDWTKLPCAPGLGFFIVGRFLDHYRFKDSDGHTSWVIREEDKGDTIEIETRNSRYTLIKDTVL